MSGSPLIGVLLTKLDYIIGLENTNRRKNDGVKIARLKLDFEKQYLCLIGQFSPFLRRSSGKKSRYISKINSRKLPPSARFIVPGAEFHGNGQPGKRTIYRLK